MTRRPGSPLARVALGAALSLGLAAGLGLAARGALHVPLRSSQGKALRWGSVPVSFVVNDKGSDNVADLSDDLAIRQSFAAWQDLPGSKIAFVENTSAAARKVSDWKGSSHLVVFDEDGDPDLLPPGSGIVAITPLSFFSDTGKIADADIVLNGADFTFTTTLQAGSFDVWATTTHEVGHFIGLDHAGLATSTMWPFEPPQGFALRTLARDDAAGAEALYPNTKKATLTGFVVRSTQAPVVGANVWARSVLDGRVATGTISDATGRYTLTGLEPGTYRVVAGPYDGAMTAANLSFGNTVGMETNFQPGLSVPIALAAGEDALGPQVVVGDDAAINVTGPGVPRQIHPGEVKQFALTGSGLAGTVVSIPDAGIALTASGTASSFTVTASANALPGTYDLFVTNGANQVADHAGALEVLPLAPQLSTVTPSVGSTAGGTTVLLDGDHFSGAPEVLFGDVVAASVALVSPTRLVVTAPARPEGTVDVSVVGGGGETATAFGSFTFVDGVLPGIASVFPAVGSTAGGTPLTITGSGFALGATVKIGGVLAGSVVVAGPGSIDLLAPALAAGSHDVLVSNPGPDGLVGLLPGGFTAVAAPDPSIASLDPPEAGTAGGDVVTLSGAGLDPAAVVLVGADPATGLGGAAASVLSANANQIVFEAPSRATKTQGLAGEASILLRLPNGQVAVAAPGLVYVPSMGKSGKLSGAIAPPGDVDAVFLDTIAGATLAVSVSASAKSLLQPQLVVKDGNGGVLATVGAPGLAKASAAGIVVPSTGRVRIEIAGIGGTSGAYAFSLKETLPKSQTSLKIPINPPTAVGPGVASFLFEAKAGSLLKGTIAVKNGLQAVVADLVGPSGSILGDPAVASKIVVAANGAIQLKGVPLPELGSYQLQVGPANNTTGTIAGTITVAPPKSLAKFAEK